MRIQLKVITPNSIVAKITIYRDATPFLVLDDRFFKHNLFIVYII